MTNSTTDDGPARFAELARIATQLFGTKQWRVQFCQRYGIAAKSTITAWATKGPPEWALVAIRDALVAETVRRSLEALNQPDG